MPDDLPLAIFAHPEIPTEHWEPRCEICRWWRDQREAYDYVTATLMGRAATLAQIQATLQQHWGLAIELSQLSRHRTRHLLPDLRQCWDTWVRTQAVLAQLGHVDSFELARQCLRVELMELHRRAEGITDDIDRATFAQTIARVSKELAVVELRQVQLAQARADLRTTEAEAAQAEGDYRADFAKYIKENYPHLVPALRGDPQAVEAALGEGQV